MPPKAYPILAPPSPVIPTEINDDHDVLCVMDMLDTLDSIPGELTQRFGDLRELDAVLNATTVHLTSRLETLTQVLQKATATATASDTSVATSSHKRALSTGEDAAGVAIERMPRETEEPMKIDQLPPTTNEEGEAPTSNVGSTSTGDLPETSTMLPSDPEPQTTAPLAPASAPVAPAQAPALPSKPTSDDPDATDIIPDQPWDRFQILLEIAEELSRFKVGVEDKVKVAGSACDHVIQHQSHIASLLSHSTLLLPSHPGSSHTGQAVPGYAAVQAGPTAGGKRHRNSPMPSRYANLVNTTPSHLLPSGSQYPNGTGSLTNNNGAYGAGYAGSSAVPAPGSETPSKKRRKTAAAGAQQGGKEKKVVGQPGQGDEFWADGDLGGAGNVKGGKRWDGTRPQNPFNTDHYSGLSGYPEFPAHLQSAQQGGKRNSPSVAGSVRGGSVMPSIPGVGVGGGESGSGSGSGAKTTAGGKKKSGNGGGAKKGTGSSGLHDGKTGGQNGSTAGGGRKKSTKVSASTEEYGDYPSRPGQQQHQQQDPTGNQASWALGVDPEVDVEMDPEEVGEGDGEADTRLYCYCQKTSFGEMIGCDDDACVYEWFHLSCLRLDRPPEGTWLCPDCAIRSERRAATKKKREVKGKDGAGGRKNR